MTGGRLVHARNKKNYSVTVSSDKAYANVRKGQ